MSIRKFTRHGLAGMILVAALAGVAAAQAQAPRQQVPRQTVPIVQPRQLPSRQADGESSRGPASTAAGQTRTRLTPQQQAQLDAQLARERAQLDQVLDAWESESKKIKTLSAGFKLWVYNSAFPGKADPGQPPGPTRKSEGEIYFAAPDQGMYREKTPNGEYWVCDGKSIYQIQHAKKELVETVLPEELRGKAISNGPLPFVFGAEAAKMKQRYSMRVITPRDVRGQIWLEAYPRFQQDAANFRKVEVILDEQTMLPVGLQLFEPGPPTSPDRRVYAFGKPKVNDLWEKIKNFFDPPLVPRGYKKVVEESPVARNAAPPRGGQAQRVPPPTNGLPLNKR
jgi:TIGR03009 family protein